MWDPAAAARVIRDHRQSGRPLPGLPEALRPAGTDAAYAVQEALHALQAAGPEGAQAGHKIGCTTPVMQAFLRIAHPCAGGVLATGVHASPARLRYGQFQRVGVECEIAVYIERDLPAQGAPYDQASVAAAVGACGAAVELVDDRYVDYRSLDTPTLIADDFFDCGCVLAAPVRDWRALDLAGASGSTHINGVEVGRGHGGDVMGHPLAALAWLANHLAARGRGLRAGEFVLTGSVVETRWVARGDLVQTHIDGLGGVTVQFEA